ncbi:septin and tuftelin-interacting protein [Trifolium repens]|jgi:hypothetical protein|nr:septin and tuftelin-interacting protein [Trifolium repens]
MHQFIVPKLKAVLKDDDFQVNPEKQNLNQFYWVMNWASAIPIHLMVDMMEIFFAKWLTAILGDAVNADGVSEMSMKQLIEAYAQDYGLLFKLKLGRMQNGHQIYRFGNVSIIIDSLNQKVCAQNDETWSLETLERLLELHKRC